MRKILIFLVLILLILTQASFASDAKKHKAEENSSKQSIACPSQDFNEFLQVFADSEEIQRTFTKFPLETMDLEDGPWAEPKIVDRILNRHQVKFPLLPLSQKRKSIPLLLKVVELSDHRATVKMWKPDTGWLVEYFFNKNDCWELIRIENHSL